MIMQDRLQESENKYQNVKVLIEVEKKEKDELIKEIGRMKRLSKAQKKEGFEKLLMYSYELMSGTQVNSDRNIYSYTFQTEYVNLVEKLIIKKAKRDVDQKMSEYKFDKIIEYFNKILTKIEKINKLKQGPSNSNI